jgi:hypothetical protein
LKNPHCANAPSADNVSAALKTKNSSPVFRMIVSSQVAHLIAAVDATPARRPMQSLFCSLMVCTQIDEAILQKAVPPRPAILTQLAIARAQIDLSNLPMMSPRWHCAGLSVVAVVLPDNSPRGHETA